jgi:hypothetical protein
MRRHTVLKRLWTLPLLEHADLDPSLIIHTGFSKLIRDLDGSVSIPDKWTVVLLAAVLISF